jgi:hypothetical protein
MIEHMFESLEESRRPSSTAVDVRLGPPTG